MANLVLNPGFENGFTNWDLNDPNNLIVINNTQQRSGTQCAEFSAGSSGLHSLTQDIPTVIGSVYQITIWVKPDINNSTPRAFWFTAGTTVISLEFTSSSLIGDNLPLGQYTAMNARFTANSSITTIGITFITSSGIYYFDDVSFELVDNNIIYNPGFELGALITANGWSTESNSGTAVLNTSDPRTGDACLQLSVDANEIVREYQYYVTCLVGASYRVSLWVKSISSITDIDVNTGIENVSPNPIINIAFSPNGSVDATNYTEIIFDFVATNPVYDFIVRNGSPNDDSLTILIDDINVFRTSVICFAGDSRIYVRDDQGHESYARIDAITSQHHQVYQPNTATFEPIIYNAITGPTNRFAMIRENLLGPGIPFQDLYLTTGHRVMYNGVSTKARDIPGVVIKKHTNQNVYTIVTQDKSTIMVNGLEAVAYGLEEWHDYVDDKKIAWSNNV